MNPPTCCRRRIGLRSAVLTGSANSQCSIICWRRSGMRRCGRSPCSPAKPCSMWVVEPARRVLRCARRSARTAKSSAATSLRRWLTRRASRLPVVHRRRCADGQAGPRGSSRRRGVLALRRAQVDDATFAEATAAVRNALADHVVDEAIVFPGNAWIVTARRP